MPAHDEYSHRWAESSMAQFAEAIRLTRRVRQPPAPRRVPWEKSALRNSRARPEFAESDFRHSRAFSGELLWGRG